MKHANIAIFVPHNGCPHQCSFCNQRTITGQGAQPTPEDVCLAVRTAEKSLGKELSKAQIAFFGGSFTAIDPEYRERLLKAAFAFVQAGMVSGIRISTRPDAITEEILAMLARYKVQAIELGAQSMDDSVLQKNGRGHTAEDVRVASDMIRKAGFSLGLQMMTGLYGDTDAGALETARALAALSPQSVRIYPTVVLRKTELAARFEKGEYAPPGIDSTVELCATLLSFFEEKGIPVIRLGLHASKDIEENYLAGAYHPALRELCESRLFRRKLSQSLNHTGDVSVQVNPVDLSKAIGQKKENILYFAGKGYTIHMVSSPEILPGKMKNL